MVGDGKLTIVRRNRREELEVKSAAAFEIGTRERIPHLPLQL